MRGAAEYRGVEQLEAPGGRRFESCLRNHKKHPFSPENGCFSNFLVVTKVTSPTTWGLFGVYASGGQCFSNFLAENDFWGKTTLLGESSGKFHSKW